MFGSFPVESSCLGSVNVPIGCHDPVHNSVAGGNWVTTADDCIHTTNVTQLDFTVEKFVQNRDYLHQHHQLSSH